MTTFWPSSSISILPFLQLSIRFSLRDSALSRRLLERRHAVEAVLAHQLLDPLAEGNLRSCRRLASRHEQCDFTLDLRPPSQVGQHLRGRSSQKFFVQFRDLPSD